MLKEQKLEIQVSQNCSGVNLLSYIPPLQMLLSIKWYALLSSGGNNEFPLQITHSV